MSLGVTVKVLPLFAFGFSLLACSSGGEQLRPATGDITPVALATPRVIEAGIESKEEDLVLLEECDKIYTSTVQSSGSFRENRLGDAAVAIRICVGFNESRNRILLLEKRTDLVKADFWATNRGTPIYRNFEDGEMDNLWRWIESTEVLRTPVSTVDCITEPALDSEVVVIEIWNAGKHTFRVTSPDCSELSDGRGDTARFVKEVSTRLGVPLL